MTHLLDNGTSIEQNRLQGYLFIPEIGVGWVGFYAEDMYVS